MDSNKAVWLVHCASGEYDERCENVVAIYHDESLAKEHCSRATEWFETNILKPFEEMQKLGHTGTIDTMPLYKLSSQSPFDNGMSGLSERKYWCHQQEIFTMLPKQQD